MNYTAMQRFFLKLFLSFLGGTAAVAIVSVLSGEFGKLQEKILVTCFRCLCVQYLFDGMRRVYREKAADRTRARWYLPVNHVCNHSDSRCLG